MNSKRRAVAPAVVGAVALATAGAALADDGQAEAEPAGPKAAQRVDRDADAGPKLGESREAPSVAQLVAEPHLDEVAAAMEREQAELLVEHPVEGPVDYGEAGAEFGASRSGHVHEGQDVFAPAGTDLVAVRSGTVVEAGSDAGRGNHVAIHSPAVRETYVYFHLLSSPEVEVGEQVTAGEKIGELGCTGSCYGDHLHFEIHRGDSAEAPAIDPLPRLQSWGS